MSGITCPSCHTVAPPGAIFCDHCGYDLRTVNATEAAFVAPAAPAASASGEIVCPLCNHRNIAGSAFCENCGRQLTPIQPAPAPVALAPAIPPAAAAPATPPPAAPPVTPLVTPAATPPVASVAPTVAGRLVVQTTGAQIVLPSGKQTVILGREDPVSNIFPDVDLDPLGGHEAGVGRRHAQLVAQSGGIYLEDLDSVNGTFVNKQRLTPRQPKLLENGTEVRLGKLVLVYFNR
jgi:hypothetical protein